MYTENYEQEIDLKDLFFAVLYRWRILLLAAVVGAALLGGYKMMKSAPSAVLEEAQDSPEEVASQYEEKQKALENTIEVLENSVEEQNRYIATAPLMQINPYQVSVSTVDVLIEMGGTTSKSGLESLLKSYRFALLNGEYLKTLADEMGTEERYLKELLSVDISNDAIGAYDGGDAVLLSEADGYLKGILHVGIIGADQDTTETFMTAVLEELDQLKDKFDTSVGSHDLSIVNQASGEQVDTGILDRQQKVRGNITTLEKNLTDFNNTLETMEPLPELTAPADTSVKDGLKYAVLGFLAGGFVSVFTVCVQYVLNDKVVSDKEIRNRFRLKSLGTFTKKTGKKKRMMGGIDAWLHRLAGDEKVWPDEAVFEMIATNVKNYSEGKTSLFVTGLASEELMEKVSGRLKEMIPELTLCTGRDMISNASARRDMAESEGIILVEERGVSRYSEIEQELEIAGNVGTEVVGVIVG